LRTNFISFKSKIMKKNKTNRGSGETPSYSSPRNNRKGCLCKDNTYNVKCCDGTLRAQGIGRG
jgi:hypothetical protein